MNELSEEDLQALEAKYEGHADLIYEGEKNRVILRLIDEIRRLHAQLTDAAQA